MIIAQKCNCCIHEEICTKSELYKVACRQIVHNIPTSMVDMLSVSVSCKHFYPKETTGENS